MKKLLFILSVLFSFSVSTAWADNNPKPVEIGKGDAKDPNKVQPRD